MSDVYIDSEVKSNIHVDMEKPANTTQHYQGEARIEGAFLVVIRATEIVAIPYYRIQEVRVGSPGSSL